MVSIAFWFIFALSNSNFQPCCVGWPCCCCCCCCWLPNIVFLIHSISFRFLPAWMAYAQSHAITAKKEPKRNRQQHQQQLLQVETPTEQYLVNATRVWFFLSFFSSHQYLVVCVALASYVRKKSTHTPTSKPASQHQQQQQQIEFECEHVKFCIWKPKMCFIFDVCFSCYFLFHSCFVLIRSTIAFEVCFPSLSTRRVI